MPLLDGQCQYNKIKTGLKNTVFTLVGLNFLACLQGFQIKGKDKINTKILYTSTITFYFLLLGMCAWYSKYLTHCESIELVYGDVKVVGLRQNRVKYPAKSNTPTDISLGSGCDKSEPSEEFPTSFLTTIPTGNMTCFIMESQSTQESYQLKSKLRYYKL